MNISLSENGECPVCHQYVPMIDLYDLGMCENCYQDEWSSNGCGIRAPLSCAKKGETKCNKKMNLK